MSDSSAQTAAAGSRADQQHMREALALAARIPERPWPNPPVGALVVKDGAIVGRGAHHGAGQAHAERIALAEAAGRARGATLYCTLEPCRHVGRTPPCTEAILAAGVARVVYGVGDPNPPAAGGADVLRAAGVNVTGGLLANECLDLIWPFVATDCFARPYVELKTATSLDGRFGRPHDPVGAPSYITGCAARADVHVRRRWVDLVLVGGATARSDRPRLDTRLVPPDAPCPLAEPAAGCVIGPQDIDKTVEKAGAGDGLVAAFDLRLDRSEWFCLHPGEPPLQLPAGAHAVACPAGTGGVDPHGLLAVCAERGWHTVMLEGGPTLAAAFLEAGLVDRWVQYLAPVVAGGGPTWPRGFAAGAGEYAGTEFGGFHLTSCRRFGPDLRVIWDRRDFDAAVRALSGAGGD